MKQQFVVPPAGSGPIWLLLGMTVFFILLLGLFAWIAWASRHASIEVASGELRIRGDLYSRRIPTADLDLTRARTADLTRETALQPARKRNGTAMPGYWSGWFTLRNGEKSLLLLTERRRAVYVPTTQGYSLLLSVEHPDSLLAALRKARPPAG